MENIDPLLEGVVTGPTFDSLTNELEDLQLRLAGVVLDFRSSLWSLECAYACLIKGLAEKIDCDEASLADRIEWGRANARRRLIHSIAVKTAELIDCVMEQPKE